MKFRKGLALAIAHESPPSRGAWIEIAKVALESGDVERRPPRGGRGLKLTMVKTTDPLVGTVAPLAGGVD